MKKVLLVVLVILLLAAMIAGFFVWRHHDRYISRKEAKAIAVSHFQLEKKLIKEIDVEFERNVHSAWYEVDIETIGMDYEVSIDAVSGEILASSSEVDP